MTLGQYDLTIIKGATLYRTFSCKDDDGNAVDLTGYNARMMGRESLFDTSTIFSWSSEGASPRLTVTAATGVITLSVPPSVVDALNFSSGVYDLEVYTALDADVQRILEGSVTLSYGVTHA